MAQFKNFLNRVVDVLKEVNIEYVIVGGVAIIISGRARTTTDLDLIIENNLEKIRLFMDKLKEYDFDVLPDQVEYALKEGFQLSIFDNRSILRIDISIAKSSHAQETLRTAKEVDYEGIKLKIASIEQILLGKLLYIGNIDDLTEQEILEYSDVMDFIILFETNQKHIDMNLLENKIKSSKLGNTFKLITDLMRKLKND